MNPLLREFTRITRNPAVVIVLVLLLVAGAFAPRQAAQPGPAPGFLARGALNVAISYNYSSGYHFGIVSFDGSGSIVNAVHVRLEFMPANTSGPPVGNATGITDSRGLLALNWSAAPCRCSVSVNASGAPGSETLGFPLAIPPPVNLTPLGSAIFLISSGLFVGRPALLVAISNGDQGAPAGTYLASCAPSSSVAPSTCTPHVIGAVTATPQIFPTQLLGSIADSEVVNISLLDDHGLAIQSFQVEFGGIDPYNSTNAVITAAGTGLATGVQTLSFIVSLAGALIGYMSYARDRLNGCLDAVLALPITRTRLVLSRYSGALAVSSMGAVAGGVIFCLSLSKAAGVALPSSVWLAIAAAFVAQALAFVGLSFFGAHIIRSSPLLLVMLILLVILFTVLWTPVVSSAASLAGSSVGPMSPILANPALTSGSIVGLTTFKIDGGIPFLLPTITDQAVLAGVVIGWIIAPIALAWLMFRLRD